MTVSISSASFWKRNINGLEFSVGNLDENLPWSSGQKHVLDTDLLRIGLHAWTWCRCCPLWSGWLHASFSGGWQHQHYSVNHAGFYHPWSVSSRTCRRRQYERRANTITVRKIHDATFLKLRPRRGGVTDAKKSPRSDFSYDEISFQDAHNLLKFLSLLAICGSFRGSLRQRHVGIHAGTTLEVCWSFHGGCWSVLPHLWMLLHVGQLIVWSCYRQIGTARPFFSDGKFTFSDLLPLHWSSTIHRLWALQSFNSGI